MRAGPVVPGTGARRLSRYESAEGDCKAPLPGISGKSLLVGARRRAPPAFAPVAPTGIGYRGDAEPQVGCIDRQAPDGTGRARPRSCPRTPRHRTREESSPGCPLDSRSSPLSGADCRHRGTSPEGPSRPRFPSKRPGRSRPAWDNPASLHDPALHVAAPAGLCRYPVRARGRRREQSRAPKARMRVSPT